MFYVVCGWPVVWRATAEVREVGKSASAKSGSSPANLWNKRPKRELEAPSSRAEHEEVERSTTTSATNEKPEERTEPSIGHTCVPRISSTPARQQQQPPELA